MSPAPRRRGKAKPITIQKIIDDIDPQLEGNDRLVYFARRFDGAVKIGVSTSPMIRLREIERDIKKMFPKKDHSVKLIGVIQGGFAVERYLHKSFARHALGWEWFRPVRKVMALIDEVNRIAPMGDPLGPFLWRGVWCFYAGGRLFGPYALQSTAEQRREDYLAYAVTAPGCHCAVAA